MERLWTPPQRTVFHLGGESVVARGIPGKKRTNEEILADPESRASLDRWIKADIESDDEVTEEDWRKIRNLLGSQGLRLKNHGIDAATEFQETGESSPDSKDPSSLELIRRASRSSSKI